MTAQEMTAYLLLSAHDKAEYLALTTAAEKSAFVRAMTAKAEAEATARLAGIGNVPTADWDPGEPGAPRTTPPTTDEHGLLIWPDRES